LASISSTRKCVFLRWGVTGVRGCVSVTIQAAYAIKQWSFRAPKMGKAFGLLSLAGSLFSLLFSEFHVSWPSSGFIDMMLFLMLLPPWGYLAVFMGRHNVNVGDEASRQEKAKYVRRVRELLRRFPLAFGSLLAILLVEIFRCVLDPLEKYWLIHLLVAFFFFPAMMLLWVFPRSEDLLAKWKREDELRD
jgi:hypothetical protein